MVALSRRKAQYKASQILLEPCIELRLMDILCLEARPSFALYYNKTRWGYQRRTAEGINGARAGKSLGRIIRMHAKGRNTRVLTRSN